MNGRCIILHWLLPLVTPLLVACGKGEEEAYPPILTEYADVLTDASGRMTQLVLDDSTTYVIANCLTGYQPEVMYRVLCGFVPQGDRATLYQMEGVILLSDSTAVACHDAVDVVSAWRTSRYVNLHLSVLTQGRTHYWGFSVDSLRPTHAYLHLHHDRRDDPLSYSTTVYASLPLRRIPSLFQGDSITLRIHTTSGEQTLEFVQK